MLDRVDKHDGHWFWTGSMQGDTPLITIDYQRRAARQVAWEVFVSPDVPDRVASDCGEVCIKPQHLVSYNHGCTDPEHVFDSWGACNDCRLKRRLREKWTCGCGRSVLKNNRWKHQQSCTGERKTTRRAPQTPQDTIQDAVSDWKKGITPDRICEAYSTTPGALLQALYRARKRDPDFDHPFFRRDLEALRREHTRVT